MKQNYKTLMTMLLMLLAIGSANAQITLSATAGTTSGSFSTLKAAFDAINSGTHQGAIDIRVHANTTETASASLDSSGNATGSSYTSILIRPADTATVVKNINCSVGGIAIVNLNGADNVTFDGRPLSTGTTSLLRINSTATIASSFNIRLINGAQGNSITYMLSQCNLNPSVTTIIHLLFNSGTSTTASSNNTVQYNTFTGGSQGVQFTGTVAFTSNNTLYKNIIEDFRSIGILLSNGITSVTIDSNIIRHNSTFSSIETSTAAVYGVDMNFLISNSTINFTRNTILDLSLSAATSSTGLYGVRVFPQTAGVVNANVNIFNNIISLTRTNSLVTGSQIFQGIRFSGSAPANCRVINNTIRIGGTATAASAGIVNSIGIFKANSSATTNYICRNNIITNERAITSGFCAASWVSSVAGATLDIDNNVYYTPTGNYTALWFNGTNSSIYTTTAAYKTGALVAPNEQNSVFNIVTYTSASNLSLAGASINNYEVLGTPRNALVTSDITGTSRLNPTYRGAIESTPFTNRIDASVKEVYSLGKLPIPYANPHVIRANIQNTGIDTIFGQKVYVNVAGANSFTDSVVIDTIAPKANKYAVFTSYSYVNVGSGTVTVTVPNDSTNTNNSKTFNQNITTGTYAYADPTLVSAGGVGFNGVGGDFIAKFPYSGSNNINQVGVNFNTGGQPYQIVIYSMVNDTPGTLLWNSSTLTSTAGVNTINVNPVVPVSGSFFVGVRQTGTTNVAFGYQAEDPIRNGVFYYKSTNVTSWADFASTNSAFRFMVEPRLQIADDIGAQSVSLPCNMVVQNSPAIFPSVKIFNYGLNGYSSVTVKSSITGPVSYSNTTFFPSISLSSNTSADLVLNSSFNPTTVGTYTMKVWTELSGDLEPNNDTITYIFNVVDNNTATNAGNHLVLNGTNQSITVPYNGSLDITGSMLTLESWVYTGGTGTKYLFSREQSAGVSQFELYMNPAGALTFKLRTQNGVDSVLSTKTLSVLSYAHVAATYDGTQMTLYMNGDTAGVKSLSGTLMSTSSPLYIGQSTAGGASFWNGNLDDVKIWDTVRTDDQIRKALHTRRTNFSNAYLKGYWRMDESSGNYVADAAGNCNNGIINGAATFATSNVTLGTPLVDMQTVSTSGATAFTATAVTVNSFNQSGDNQFYVHKFAAAPKGTSPVTSPGGVINVSNNTWFIYRYGTGSMDSSIVDFSVGSGIPAVPVPADIKLFSRGVGDDGNWTKLRDSATSMSFATQTISMMMSPVEFNKQLAIGANSNALPVKLVFFGGKRNNAHVDLSWITASETNNAGFTIERSIDGKAFTKVAFIEGKGNSSKTNTYSLMDKDAFATTRVNTLYYRLVQSDFSGKTTTSNTVSVKTDNEQSAIATLYPNPFSNELHFTVDSKVQAMAGIVVTDIAGKTIVELNQPLTMGLNTIETNQLAQLPKGIYLIQLSVNGQVTTHKLVKQ